MNQIDRVYLRKAWEWALREDGADRDITSLCAIDEQATGLAQVVARKPGVFAGRAVLDLLKEAYAVAVIPDVLKAGFVIGGRHGQGLIAVKSADGTWSNPSFVSMGGGSVGFQAGVQSTDVVLVFRSQRGVESIVHGKFTLGADAAVAAGPVGRDAQASTDAQLKAEIYSYSRARGLFAGVALDGSVISIDNDANQEVYGKGVTPRRIFEGGVSGVPTEVVDFRDRLEEYTSR